MRKVPLFRLILVFALGILTLSFITSHQLWTMYFTPHHIQLPMQRFQNNDTYASCLLQAARAYADLSLPWFLTFSTALMYHRSNSLHSHDIDTGVFIDDFSRRNITDRQFISTFAEHGFKVSRQFGRLQHGREWQLRCPHAKLHFDVFVFYRAAPRENGTFTWWTASYQGLCNEMRYGKCRWWFSNFEIESFVAYEQVFQVVSKQFLVEQYGSEWIKPKKYGYYASLKFLPNLIDERRVKQQRKRMLQSLPMMESN